MATQFSDLQKLLINVASDKCDAFIKAHVNAAWDGTASELPSFTAAETDAYYNKVVFLKKYNAIYTKGTFFGYNGDLKASFNDLVEDLKTGVTEKGITVKYDADQNKIVTTVDAATYTAATGWVNTNNVVTGTAVKTYVDEKVAGAVAEATAAMNFRGPITETSFDTIKAAASNGDVYVVEGNFTINTEKFEEGDLVIFAKEGEAAATYTVVERNLDDAIVTGTTFNDGQLVVAEGTGKVKTTGYVIGGDILSDNLETRSLTLATEAAVSGAIGAAVHNMVHNNGSGQGTYMTYTYHTTDGITYIDSIDPKLATIQTTYGDNGEYILGDATTGLVNHDVLNTVISYYDGVISYLDGKIDAVDCEVTTLTEVSDSDYFSVTEDSTDKTDNDRNYKIELNVVNLGDAVGMTYDEATGKWSAPEGSTAVNGLASAADVANELVSDEKVIAAALNDHETRIDTLESFAGDIDNTIQTQLVRGEVTINGLTATATKEGLVDATILANAINALDPWEEYA
jgi:hypothetical protein